MKVLDLFSGLGGFSEAFLLQGDEVERVENNPLLQDIPETTLMCVLELRDYLRRCKDEGLPIIRPDVVLAAPPCYEFSLAYSAPQAIASRKEEFEEYEPDMTLIEATIEIIQILNPRYYVIENVMGSIRHFEKIGLEVNQIHGACVFYGRFPKFSTPDMPTKAEKDKRWSPLRANHRALIPLPLSKALRKAILEQKTLFDYHSIAED